MNATNTFSYFGPIIYPLSQLTIQTSFCSNTQVYRGSCYSSTMGWHKKILPEAVQRRGKPTFVNKVWIKNNICKVLLQENLHHIIIVWLNDWNIHKKYYHNSHMLIQKQTSITQTSKLMTAPHAILHWQEWFLNQIPQNIISALYTWEFQLSSTETHFIEHSIN